MGVDDDGLGCAEGLGARVKDACPANLSRAAPAGCQTMRQRRRRPLSEHAPRWGTYHSPKFIDERDL